MIAGAHRDLSEWYASATTHGVIYSSLTIESSTPSGKTSRRLNGRDIDVVIAAGWARHWATAAIRLKFGLDATVYGEVLRQFHRLALDTGDRLEWGDAELTAFLAEDVLLGWLLDRAFQGKGEWKRRCIFLRNKLNTESLEAASIMALKLGYR